MELVEQIFIVLAYIAVIGFAINGLDDLFFDTQFLLHLWRARRQPHITLEQLNLAAEQWIAIFVPAWAEGGVVNKMAEYAARVVSYEKYDIFVGVYPNDPETNRCVDEICATNPRIHKALVPHNGPTNKADCLNAIYRTMRLSELPGVREYRIIAIHDSEDVIHPLAAKVYNYFVGPQYDMVQVPVFALELPIRFWTGNTYIDDFAELHTKDLFTRQSIGGIVPSAGVGTAFSRTALDALAADNNGDPFLVGNLTEDYEVGIRTKRAGFRTGFVSYPVERIVRRERPDGSLAAPETLSEVVAIRESFPTRFSAAVRQRSRWILGISYQTWEQTGWRGTIPMRYTLFRDRRAPLTHVINFAGYLLLGYMLALWIFRQTQAGAQFFVRPLFATDSWLWKLVIIDTCLLLYRAAQRFVSVWHIYNFRQAVFSIPRLVWGNFINFFATIKATRLYLAYKLFNRPFVWAKTTHIFPEEKELGEYTRSVEDLLVQEGFVTRDQVFTALNSQKTRSAPLALWRLGLLREKDYTAAWAKHSGLPVRSIQPTAIPEPLLRRFSERLASSVHALPVEVTSDGKAVVAFREPPNANELAQLGQLFDAPVRPVLARPSTLAFGRDRAYPALVLPQSRAGEVFERFRRACNVEPPAFLEAVSAQHLSHRSLPDVLIDLGMLREADARKLWAETLGCAPGEGLEIALNTDLHARLGPAFWWLHRMIPLRGGWILTATTPHPLLAQWLSSKGGGKFTFLAELPAKVELHARSLGLELDPDAALIDALTARNALRADALPRIRAARALIADPIQKWLLLQRAITEDQLHEAFRHVAGLPEAQGWTPEEARRLAPALAPGFAQEHGCYCLRESERGVLLGLSQLPSVAALNEIHDRLASVPIFFQALSLTDTQALKRLL